MNPHDQPGKMSGRAKGLAGSNPAPPMMRSAGGAGTAGHYIHDAPSTAMTERNHHYSAPLASATDRISKDTTLPQENRQLTFVDVVRHTKAQGHSDGQTFKNS